ncbi:MAG: M23 family metallopeptidase [Aggregatilineales bacterium]
MSRLRLVAAPPLLVGVALFATLFGQVHAQTAPTPVTAAPTANATLGPHTVNVQFAFKSIKQGRAGLVTIDGANLAAATANALGRTTPCFPTHTGFGCLIAVPMDQAVKAYPISLAITAQDGTPIVWSSTFSVTSGQFLAETLNLPGYLLFLLHDDVQANENDRLLTAYSIVTPVRYWEGPFTLPVNGAAISPFGAVRNYNGLAPRRHTGQDFHASMGTPVLASQSGQVVLSRLMDIHGNNIVIDHGWGIYSEYAHLSERYVVPGQFVVQGQIIGLSGSTGRSTGPHVHWEIAVNDVWVNPLDFAQIQLPPP